MVVVAWGQYPVILETVKSLSMKGDKLGTLRQPGGLAVSGLSMSNRSLLTGKVI